jgi:hypothetical protein
MGILMQLEDRKRNNRMQDELHNEILQLRRELQRLQDEIQAGPLQGASRGAPL